MPTTTIEVYLPAWYIYDNDNDRLYPSDADPLVFETEAEALKGCEALIKVDRRHSVMEQVNRRERFVVELCSAASFDTELLLRRYGFTYKEETNTFTALIPGCRYLEYLPKAKSLGLRHGPATVFTPLIEAYDTKEDLLHPRYLETMLIAFGLTKKDVPVKHLMKVNKVGQKVRLHVAGEINLLDGKLLGDYPKTEFRVLGELILTDAAGRTVAEVKTGLRLTGISAVD